MDPHLVSRRAVIAAAAVAPLAGGLDAAAMAGPRGRNAQPALRLPLSKDLEATTGVRATSTGPHRFVFVGGKAGYQPLGLNSCLRLPTAQHMENTGTVIMSVSPLESLGVVPELQYVASKEPHYHTYGLLSDIPQTNHIEDAIFAWYWQSNWHPQMVAKYKSGKAGGSAADFAVTPYVPVEHLPLIESKWYQLAFTWDKAASRFRIYVNGILSGTTQYPFKCEQANPSLYLGNSAMAFSDVEFYREELGGDEIAARYQGADMPKSAAVDEELRSLFTVRPRAAVDWTPGDGWVSKYQRSLTKAGDFDGWRQQGCTSDRYRLKAKEITPQGLLIETPEEIAIETRVYFWSPDSFEGDLAVEYMFRPEKETGLALLVLQATGMHREDFITDHPPRTSGSMNTIITDNVRNYHWEYFRRAVDVRSDLGTQVLVKNPWLRPLAMSTLPPVRVGEWHKLLFVQEGPRIRCGMDGKWVLDVVDEAFGHSGPVLNAGRIGLRLMYGSRMRFKDMRIWNKPRVREISRSA